MLNMDMENMLPMNWVSVALLMESAVFTCNICGGRNAHCLGNADRN